MSKWYKLSELISYSKDAIKGTDFKIIDSKTNIFGTNVVELRAIWKSNKKKDVRFNEEVHIHVYQKDGRGIYIAMNEKNIDDLEKDIYKVEELKNILSGYTKLGRSTQSFYNSL